MSILINMEMPTRCFSCPMCDVENAEVNCAISHGSYIEYREVDPKVAMQERPSWCPLIEVPPHGDLIDREPFIEFIEKNWDSYDQWFIGQLEARPTVIPADIGKVFEKFFGKDNDKDINVPCKTNADRIRAMTDEALASFLCTISNCCVGNCLGEKHCSFDNGNGYLEWLKKEVKDEHT